jgi:hypothetical protein
MYIDISRQLTHKRSHCIRGSLAEDVHTYIHTYIHAYTDTWPATCWWALVPLVMTTSQGAVARVKDIHTHMYIPGTLTGYLLLRASATVDDNSSRRRCARDSLRSSSTYTSFSASCMCAFRFMCERSAPRLHWDTCVTNTRLSYEWHGQVLAHGDYKCHDKYIVDMHVRCDLLRDTHAFVMLMT